MNSNREPNTLNDSGSSLHNTGNVQKVKNIFDKPIGKVFDMIWNQHGTHILAVPEGQNEIGVTDEDIDKAVIAFNQLFTQLSGFNNENLEGKTIVELGCGSGDYAVPIVKEHQELEAYYAVNISENQLEQALQRADNFDVPTHLIHDISEANEGDKLHLMFADALAILKQFENESVDIVILKETIMHMDRHAITQEVSRVLKKGGKVVLTDIDINMSGPLDLLVGNILSPQAFTTRFLSRDEWHTLASNSGLTVKNLVGLDDIFKETGRVTIKRMEIKRDEIIKTYGLGTFIAMYGIWWLLNQTHRGYYFVEMKKPEDKDLIEN